MPSLVTRNLVRSKTMHSRTAGTATLSASFIRLANLFSYRSPLEWFPDTSWYDINDWFLDSVCRDASVETIGISEHCL